MYIPLFSLVNPFTEYPEKQNKLHIILQPTKKRVNLINFGSFLYYRRPKISSGTSRRIDSNYTSSMT